MRDFIGQIDQAGFEDQVSPAPDPPAGGKTFNTRAGLYSAFGMTQFPTVADYVAGVTGNTGQAAFAQIIGDTSLAGGEDDYTDMIGAAYEVAITTAGGLDSSVGDAQHLQIGGTDLGGVPYAYGVRLFAKNTPSDPTYTMRVFGGATTENITIPSAPQSGDRVLIYEDSGSIYAAVYLAAESGGTWYTNTGLSLGGRSISNSVLYVQATADGDTTYTSPASDSDYLYSNYPSGTKSIFGSVV